jgi:hypothetical protein
MLDRNNLPKGFYDLLKQRFPNFYSLRPPPTKFINVTPPSTRINSNKHI